jgi:hypothetical protein
MGSNSIKKSLLLLLALIISLIVPAQVFMESGINVGIKVGGAKLIAEYIENKKINEFTNTPGLSAGIEVSKILSPHLELGAEFIYTVLNGETDETHHFSALGYHFEFKNMITGPTEYNNKLFGEGVFIRYYFIENVLGKTQFNPYLKMGFTYLSYKSIFKYKDSEEVFFGKGEENQTNLSTGSLSFGAGFKTTVSNQAYLLFSFDANMVKYDFLDVVHNYDIDGNRVNTNGLYAEIKIGLFYNTSKSAGDSGSKGKSGKSSNGKPGLPFAR